VTNLPPIKRCDECGQVLPRPRRGGKVTGIFETRQELTDAVLEGKRAGYTGKELAKMCGVSEPTVSRLWHGDRKQE